MSLRASKPAVRHRRWWGILFCVTTLPVLGLGAYLYHFEVQGHFHVVVDGKVYRSAQPSPGLLKEWQTEYGVRTVVNLRRGKKSPFFAVESRAARELGLDLRNVDWRGIGLPRAGEVRKLIEILETAERPLLLHCSRGVDRTGVASTMAAMAVGGLTYDEARDHMSFRYLRLLDSAEDIGGLLHQYESYCIKRGKPTGDWRQFKEWALETYHPHYYRVEIVAPAIIEASPGEKRDFKVTITNRSLQTIPASDSQKQFYLVLFSGTSVECYPDRLFGPWVRLPQRNIAPGESIEVTQTVNAPSAPGRYSLHLDLVENRAVWFAYEGSPMGTCELAVSPRVHKKMGLETKAIRISNVIENTATKVVETSGWQGRSRENVYRNGNMYWEGMVSAPVLLKEGEVKFILQARGTPAKGVWPHMVVILDDEIIGEVDVTSRKLKDYEFKKTVKPGKYYLYISFTNDGVTLDKKGKLIEDRNLFVRRCGIVYEE